MVFASHLKIISIKGTNSEVQVQFNNSIKEKDFSKYSINSGIYYDIKAELAVSKETFKLGKNSIKIAPNTKTITRIVIETKESENLYFNINNKRLTLSFKNNSATKIDSNKTNANNLESSNLNIANLFNSLDLKSINPSNKQDSTKIKDSTQQTDSTLKSAAQNNTQTNNNKNKIIVLDPGHGGKDCGASVGKICEKTITLNISKKTAEILKSRGYAVYTTRNSDKYISLTDRTKMANDKNADVFISIHANALDKKSKNYKSANGIETYFLSTARSERAKKVAELENKDDIEVMNYFSKLSFLNSINSQRLLASNKLAIDIQGGMLMNARNLHKGVIDGGVREGPFWVLAGALMPSILIEVGYMTNALELTRMQTKEYQNAIASGIADGIDGYFLKNF